MLSWRNDASIRNKIFSVVFTCCRRAMRAPLLSISKSVVGNYSSTARGRNDAGWKREDVPRSSTGLPGDERIPCDNLPRGLVRKDATLRFLARIMTPILFMTFRKREVSLELSLNGSQGNSGRIRTNSYYLLRCRGNDLNRLPRAICYNPIMN